MPPPSKSPTSRRPVRGNLARRTTRCTPVSQSGPKSLPAVRREHQFIARPLAQHLINVGSKICAPRPAAVWYSLSEACGMGAEENQMDEGAEHSRRTFVRAVTVGTLAAGFEPAHGPGPRRGLGRPRRVPRLGRTSAVRPRGPRAVRGDFGHLVHRTPLAVLEPGSVADIAAMIDTAAPAIRSRRAARGIRRTPGPGHRRLVIDMSRLNSIAVDPAARTASVGGAPSGAHCWPRAWSRG